MPPQNTETITKFVPTEDDLNLLPDHLEGEENGAKHRDIEFNAKEILENLRNLDYSKVVWRNVILFVLLHIYSVHGLYLALTTCMWRTLAFSYFMYLVGAMGITMGVHRLWSHRSFKARFPLKVLLAVCQTVSFQNSIFEWARDHRVHHKFSETDADPHNAKRGFFFSHMGWLLYRKHPDVARRGKTIDLSDLLADPVVAFQRKYYLPLVVLCCFVIPTIIPCWGWGESPLTALLVPGFLRYTLVLHFTWFVNSLAHWVGSKPYEKGIYPSQNRLVALLAMGEGWHNYHHVFPYDYRTAEVGGTLTTNFTTKVIDFFARIGWAYDLKTVDEKTFLSRAMRTGDGSHAKLQKKK